LAFTLDCWHLPVLFELLARLVPQEHFVFSLIHPLIRDLEAYDNLVPVCFSTASQNTPNPHLITDEHP
jgi:hypothetical protein